MRSAGVLGELSIPLGFGLLRLGTTDRPAEADAVGVIQAALDAGVRLLDTADVYSLGPDDLHYGERLARQAVDTWHGPREEIRILTKAGLSRPKGRWVPNGRPEHLRRAVEGSLRALGVERLFCLQLHARDSRVPFEETLAALAELQRAGKIEHLGLCNVSVAEIRQAQRHFPVAVVQNELSLLQRNAATDGVLAFTEQERIPFLAHRPLGGYAKVAKLDTNRVLGPLAERHRVSPRQMALAALLASASHIVPLIGATKVDSVRSSAAALQVRLDVSDRTALEIRFSFAASPESLAALRPVARPESATPLLPGEGPGSAPEVVIVMGIQGAGKSEHVAKYVAAGYARLNRDLLGGKLDDLVPKLAALLAAGQRQVVLDNTYPTRVSRAAVIAAAHAHGVPVRCQFLATPLADAHQNLVHRQLEKYGCLLGPDEMKRLAKTDPSLPPPLALSRWSSSFESPAVDEGFAIVETIEFVRRVDSSHTGKGLLLDVDGTLRRTRSGELYPRSPEDVELLPGRREVLSRWIEAGYQLFFVSNQSGIASGKLPRAAAEMAFLKTAELLALPVVEVAFCPHPAFPVGCYCRKPMPGLGVYLMRKYGLAREHLLVVGDMDSDAQFAAAIGARYEDAETFFGLNGRQP